jgi:IclR family acetate operon transcriptional repressor
MAPQAAGSLVPEDSALAESGGTSAADRVLAVLCAFSREAPVLGVTEIAERLELTKSTVHRLLQVLLARGLVTQDPARRHYTLGYRVLALAHAVPGDASLRQICRPHMRWLQETTDETIDLFVVAGDVRICLDEIESSQMLRMSAGLGRTFPLGRGAAGKALLLYEPEDGPLWRRVTGLMSGERVEWLRAELAAVRERGYARSAGETEPGSASIALPIRSPDGSIAAALSVAGPASRLTDEIASRHARALAEAVARIERDLNAAYAPGAPRTPSPTRA